MLAHPRGERRGDRLAGLGPACVHDAAAGVAALAAEVVVELDARLDQVGDACRRLLGQHADGAVAAEPTAGAQRVLGVQRGIVVLSERRCDATLGVPAVRGRDRRLREQEHVGTVRRAERGVEAGDTAADDEKIGRERFSPQSR